MQSRVYQLAAIHDPAAIPGDPANDLLSGYRPRRLDAESIRDSLLMVSGELDLTPPGPHPFPPMWEWRFTQHNPFKAVYETNRRSVYLMAQRIQRHPYLAIFDGPDPAASTPVRLVSTTPLQALFLLNDPFVHRQADSFAARLLSEAPDQQSRIDLAYEILLARPPSDEERQAGARYLAQARQLLKDSVAAGELDRSAWQSYVRTLLRLNEFVYLD